MKNDYSHIIQYIKEADQAREPVIRKSERTREAYRGNPSVRKYKADPKNKARKVSQEKPDLIYECIETNVSAIMGGIDRWDFVPYDGKNQVNARTMDRLDCATQNFYQLEDIEQKFTQAGRNSYYDGGGFMYMRHNKKKHRPEVTLLPRQQIIQDPKRKVLPEERFIGHQQRESFKSLKGKLLTGSRKGVKLKDIKGTELHLKQIADKINQSDMGYFTNDDTDFSTSDPLRYTLCSVYKRQAKQFYQRRDMGPKGKDKLKYESDDVEVTYLYETCTGYEYTIINREFVVEVRKKPFSKTYTYEVSEKDKDGNPVLKSDGTPKMKEKKFTCTLDNPYVRIEHTSLYDEQDGDSPIWHILDEFDKLADLESLLCDIIWWMSVPQILATNTDGDKLANASNIVGEIVGDGVTDAAVFNKQYPIQSLTGYIDLKRQALKNAIGCYDPFRIQAMIGDRASAKEASAAHGQVSQRHNSFISNLENAASDLGNKFLKMMFINEEELLYADVEDSDKIYNDEIIGDYLVSAKLKSVAKIEQADISRRSAEVLGLLLPVIEQLGLNGKALVEETVPKILMDTISRQGIKKITGTDLQTQQIEAAAQLAQIQAQQPLDPSQVTPQQLEQLGLPPTRASAQPNFGPNPQLPVGIRTRASRPTRDPIQAATPEEAGNVANDPRGF